MWQRNIGYYEDTWNNTFLADGGGQLDSPPIPGTSPRNSSPLKDDGNLTKQLGKTHLKILNYFKKKNY